MQTRGEATVEDAKAVLKRLEKLGQGTFSRSDLSELIEPFTSRLEYFLKAVVFPSASRRRNLSELIDDLNPLGVANSSIASLHSLREIYNRSKHAPDKELLWRECVDAIQASVDALSDIAGVGLPAVDAAFEEDLSCIVYVGFWDHYTGGETEIGLFLPSDHWLKTTPISTFHLPMSNWDQLKPLIDGNPRFTRGREALGDEVWQSFSNEGDFLDAGVWQGDVRELLMLLAPFNDEKLEGAVIPFLARRNDFRSVGLGLMSAAIDIARSDPSPDVATLRERIKKRASTEYAVTAGASLAKSLLDDLCKIVGSIPPERRAWLAGPVLRPLRTHEKLASPLVLEGRSLIWILS